jgi:hypothetical protein
MNAKEKKEAYVKEWKEFKKSLINFKGIVTAEFDGRNCLLSNLQTGELSLIIDPNDEEVREIRKHHSISFIS